jgi:S-adenosylhomocysteine hydrolase
MLADGTAFMTGTTFDGKAAMRISVCNWSTTEDDVAPSLAALHRVVVGARLSEVTGT